MKKNGIPFLLIGFGLVVLIISTVWLRKPNENSGGQPFSGETALNYVRAQMDLGPRLPGSEAHDRAITLFKTELSKSGWQVTVQDEVYNGQRVQNVIAVKGAGAPWTVLGAHYDSRMAADQDPDTSQRTNPVPGANDGASGAGVLLELANVLPEKFNGQITLVFFDSEDNGNIAGWDWILGSRAYVAGLEQHPDNAIIIDMIGDKDLNIYYERNSDQTLSQEIWAAAAEAGYQDEFIQQYRHSMLDDHTPFLQAGIRAIDIIDFDYPYWHTTGDTIDKVSAESLQAVGITLQNWLKDKHAQ